MRGVILVILFIGLLVMAYSLPEIVYPEYPPRDYSGLTETRQQSHTKQ